MSTQDKNQELRELTNKYTFSAWVPQEMAQPLPITKVEGSCIYDANGKRYLDFSSQLMLTNIGHGDKRVINAIKEQADRVPYVYPGLTTDKRAELGKLLAEITPGDLCKSFITLGGADAVENAMKIAQFYTGKEKIITRMRSYHGGTFASATAGGDPRRHLNKASIKNIVRIPDPYAYRSPLYTGRTPEEGDAALADLIEETIRTEDPNTVAALMLEGWSGSSGIIAPSSPKFMQRMRELCDKYDILLISDEVMSGFGRTGKWFAIEHANVVPDMITMAKGLTSGYLPLGAVIVNEKIARYFDKNPFNCGLTYSSHAMGCAAAIANIKVYQEDGLIERAAAMGEKLEQKLQALYDKHPSIGEFRGKGLHYCIEVVKNRDTREPMSEWNQPQTEPMKALAKYLRDNGISTFVRWNFIFICPPLIITEEELDEGLGIISDALEITDKEVTN